VWRARSARPSLGYLAAGLAGAAAMNYTAYLGGSMVYHHGVGVQPAGGVRENADPEIRRGDLREVASMAGRHALQSLKEAGRDIRRGELVPALRGQAGASRRSGDGREDGVETEAVPATGEARSGEARPLH
jgi:hypothetical protein